MTKAKICTANLMLLSLLLGSRSFGQKTDFSNEIAHKFTSTQVSKGLPLPVESTPLLSEDEDVSEEVLSSFNANFKNATKVTWTQVKNKFLAKFKNDEIATETLFNKHGKIIYSIEYGYEKAIPGDVKSLVSKMYPGHIITCLSKVQKNKRQVWVVTMAGNKNDIRARIENGQIEEVETIKKG